MIQTNTNLPVSSPQMQFLSAAERKVLFCGGIGSGKTHAGALWALMMIYKHPNTTGLITANTHDQLVKATLQKLFELLEEFDIKYSYHKQTKELTVNDTKVYAYSTQNIEPIRGIEVGWCWSDECAFYDEYSYNLISGRIRDKNGPCIWRGTTTPNGFNWLYERFVEKPQESSLVVYSKTADNTANVDAGYLRDLREQYDSKLAEQELDGHFVNLTSGKVYYGFDRRINVKPVNDNHDAIFIGLDFNVHPFCGIYCNVVGNKIHVFGELYEEDSNTFKASKVVLKNFPGRLINVVCDETGNRRRSSSPNTDHEILRRAGMNVLHFKNPYIKDRDNNINRLFDQGRIIIDPSCKVLIKNLEQLVHDNKDEMLGHITDALGYIAWHFFPLKKPKKPASVKYR